ncbi:hypothetical protein [Chitinophaga varians]|uniref:hypothetical protein n=1 Tax=Chitinophaga varians TaxID=2202339 RepID=UPI00165F4E25|nr:hypothetical protein [Chitinophaga varians]MBC9913185.1 hypothetical protein [Chitinophaga varians]
MAVIRPRFSNGQIQEMLTERLKRIDSAILTRLQYIGESFVKNAREKADFTDRTGNLRNSIGYIILKNGVQMYENFRRTANVEVSIKSGRNRGQKRNTKGGKRGMEAAREVAANAAGNFQNGYVLIVVAGMEYAAFVEAMGYDVLTASSEIAKRDLQNAIKSIKQKMTRMR